MYSPMTLSYQMYLHYTFNSAAFTPNFLLRVCCIPFLLFQSERNPSLLLTAFQSTRQQMEHSPVNHRYAHKD